MKIKIRNKKDLEAFRDWLDTPSEPNSNEHTWDFKSHGVYVELLNDIDFGGDMWFYRYGGGFFGTFEGNGHRINNIKFCQPPNSREHGAGFVIHQHGIIRDLNIDCEINDIRPHPYYIKRAGGICSFNNRDIINCTVSGSIKTAWFCGGICGYNHGKLINCENRAAIECEPIDFNTIRANNYQQDQLVGLGPGKIINCKRNGSVSFPSKNTLAAQYILSGGDYYKGWNKEDFIDIVKHTQNPEEINSKGQNLLHYVCDYYRRKKLDNKYFFLRDKYFFHRIYGPYSGVPLVDIVKILATETHIDFAAKDGTGKTALDYLKMRNDPASEKFIKEKIRQQKEQKSSEKDTNFSTIGF